MNAAFSALLPMQLTAKTILLLAAAVFTGCMGSIGDAPPADDTGSEVTQCVAGPLAPSTTPLALLTPDQYQRSIRAVLADNAIALELEPPSSDTLSELAAQKLADAAAAIVARPSFAAMRSAICNSRTATACADDFIASFARRM